MSQKDVEVCLSDYQKSIDDRAKNLCAERYFSTTRSAEEHDNYFVQAICKAETKKKFVYNVDVNFDCNGTVVTCQCECAAGICSNGHCKHNCALLYGLWQFSDYREFVLEQMCAEKLNQI